MASAAPLGEALLASTASTIGEVFLYLLGGAFLVFVAVMGLSILLWPYFKARRWYRIVKAVGRSYDSDGLREHRDPEHGLYYVRDWSILKALPRSGTGWLTGDPKWCVGYSGRSGKLYVTLRSRRPRRLPKWVREIDDEELEEWRPVMEAIDRRQNPWRTDERDAPVEREAD